MVLQKEKKKLLLVQAETYQLVFGRQIIPATLCTWHQVSNVEEEKGMGVIAFLTFLTNQAHS